MARARGRTLLPESWSCVQWVHALNCFTLVDTYSIRLRNLVMLRLGILLDLLSPLVGERVLR
jgi:hypothetical protein